MPEFTDNELLRIRDAAKTLLRDSFIPRENPNNSHCKDVFNTIVNPRYREAIEDSLEMVGFSLHVSSEPGMEAVWVTDTDEENVPKETLDKAYSMVYVLLTKKFLEDRSSETKTTASVIDVQTLMDQMRDLNKPITKKQMRDILFTAQGNNLVSVMSSKNSFEGTTTVVILPSICFFFSIESVSVLNEYLDQCAMESKSYDGDSAGDAEE